MTSAQLTFDSSGPFSGVEEVYGSDDVGRVLDVLTQSFINICNNFVESSTGVQRTDICCSISYGLHINCKEAPIKHTGRC